MSRFPNRVLDLDFERDILGAEQKLIKEYGFLKEEINFIMKHKPTLILFEQGSDENGLKGMIKFFVNERGFDMDVVRALALKYPFVLSKQVSHFKNFFDILQRNGLTEDETIRALLECPKLISRDLEKQIKEINFLFNLYHGIKDQQVFEIFRSFPYLYCCEIKKIQYFMGEFKKYRFTNQQIINLVSYHNPTLLDLDSSTIVQS